MSRLIVKGLPKEINEDQMKEFFGKKFHVTDCKIMRSDKGESRRFGFLGLKNESDAQTAIKYFNNTFFRTCKISLDFAKTQTELGNSSKKTSKVDDLKQKIKQSSNASLFDKVSRKETVETTSELDTKRLYVTNLTYQVSEDELRELFGKYGEITEITLPTNYKTKQTLGFCFVAFATEESALLCLSQLDMTVFQGRIIHMQTAKPKNSIVQEKNLSEVEQKKKNKEEAAGQDAWNYLFLNQNAVIDAVAKKYKLKKSEVLDKTNSEVALQISSMETMIINETKAWLKEQGINLDVLKGDPKAIRRSKTVLLVKNISTSTTIDEIEKLFGRYGKVVKVLLSPSNTIGLVELMNADHCQNCLTQLSKAFLNNNPIYLEPAPEGMIETTKRPEQAKEFDKGDTLFIQNLSFATTEKELEKTFLDKGHTAKITIVKKNINGEFVSNGFGFAKFETEAAANLAIREMQGVLVDGHCLDMKIAKSTTKQENLGRKRKTPEQRNEFDYDGDEVESTKILVKNLAFEATKDELRKLFKEKGEIKAINLPMKMDGSTRGFGFVSFVSKEEAVNAFRDLQNTHFYGRKLVLEWAKKDETVDEKRESTKAKLKVMMTTETGNQAKGKFKKK